MANELTIGRDIFKGDKIISANAFMAQSIGGDELQYNTLTARLELGDLEQLDSAKMAVKLVSIDPPIYKYGTPVTLKHDGILVGKFFVNSVKRVSRTQYNFSCVSAIGLLVKSRHYGGVYTQTPLLDVLSDIVGNTFPYTYSPEIERLRVSGWLPVAPRRENLHQLLFAYGIGVTTDPNGDVYFTPFKSSVYTNIPDHRIYIGGSVKYPDGVTKVSVMEHGWYATPMDQMVSLFNDEIMGETVISPKGIKYENCGLVVFREPAHDLVVEGSTILESGVNYAVLSQSISANLSGKRYAHTVRQIQEPPDSTVVAEELAENRKTVSDATLVSIVNGESVAKRVYSYYNAAKTIENSIVLADEKAGSAVRFNDPFGDETVGFIQSMDVNLSNVLKAQLEIISGYTPIGPESGYEHVAIIDKSQVWTVPNGVEKIHVVLIQGGTGGWSGLKGEDSPRPSANTSEHTYSNAKVVNKYFSTGDLPVRRGGDSGKGGLPGKVLRVTLKVTAGKAYKVTAGVGGSGGVFAHNESVKGTDGTPSTFGEYSSANGQVPATGFSEVFSGDVYALPGSKGIKGGNGQGFAENAEGKLELIDAESVTGPDGTVYPGGKQYEGADKATSDRRANVILLEAVASGGYGGGAAVGAQGADGGEGGSVSARVSSYEDLSTSTSYVSATGGTAGMGASATAPAAQKVYGQGGDGGHGGGGAGITGAAGVEHTNWNFKWGNGGISFAPQNVRMTITPSVSNGGNGSNGGDGGPGCVIIYY